MSLGWFGTNSIRKIYSKPKLISHNDSILCKNKKFQYNKQRIVSLLIGKAKPLPEKGISPIYNVIKVNDFCKPHNSLTLGNGFIGALYKTLSYSVKHYSPHYYLHSYKLMKEANPITIIGCISNLRQKQFVCENICQYIVGDPLRINQAGFKQMIDIKIILALKYSSKFPKRHYIKELITRKFVKSEVNDNNFSGLLFYFFHYYFEEKYKFN